MTDQPDSQSEALDEDKIHDLDDFSGDEYGDGLPGYPPDRPLGDSFGVTALDQQAGESFAARTLREQPDFGEEGAVTAEARRRSVRRSRHTGSATTMRSRPSPRRWPARRPGRKRRRCASRRSRRDTVAKGVSQGDFRMNRENLGVAAP